MDKIKFDFFDVLGYLIPGTALLMALWITADREVVTMMDLYKFVSKISTNTLLSGIVVAYIIGFTLHFLGSFLFTHIYLFIWHRDLYKARKKNGKRAAYQSLYWAYIREHGDKHLPMLDRWQALKALSSNLAAFSLVATGLCLLKWFITGCLHWLYIAPVLMFLYHSYSNRAFKFGDFLQSDADAVLIALDLKEKFSAEAASNI